MNAAPAPGRARGPHYALTQWRLATGLVLFAFAATHFANHALGLVSLDAMEAVRQWRIAVTRSLPGTVVLGASALIHLALGLGRLVQRRSLRMAPSDAVQLVFGLLIPFLLLPHLIGTRFAHELIGHDDRYANVVRALWPDDLLRQSGLLLVVWVHGCIGLHHWLSFKPWYRRAAWALYAGAIALPLLSLAGFITAGRTLPPHPLPPPAPTATLPPEAWAGLRAAMDIAPWLYLALLAAVLAWRFGRGAADRLLPQVRVSYVGGPTVTAPPGLSLLEVSRRYGIPHASVCDGHARCSTCRVRVLQGIEHLPEPSRVERQVLERVGAGPNVRLACQLVPSADLQVATLLPAQPHARAVSLRQDRFFWGVEQPVTIMFADLRGFTALSETRLPYDVVFMLNQYLGPMSEVILEHGGYVDKFMGDGILAIFGIDRPPTDGARRALAATRGMAGTLQALNACLHTEFARPFDIGIGLHFGPAVLGRIGTTALDAASRITALGDTVNTANRLESACKELGVQVVVSQATIAAAGYTPCAAAQPRSIQLRGKAQPLEVFAFHSALDIPQPGAPASPPPLTAATAP
ncbi:adenylate cyclase [Plasticicumulans lactativorans]|uniref:Adenylate cyclase n=1 Tax=Plasticicumulans lactativorans TaxID=1133106 RepID=A0A4R2L1C6_9GAMM|nr:adenylate/guanylate cyclase domain-containing protein [Plasticicumulans lactativorans]TCO77536.1 adenylate cyclase [Plasticicumulans lactativorans]